MAHSKATRVYIANLMTQPGETEHFSVADHVRAIYNHTRPGLFDWAVVNRTPVPARLRRRYRAEGCRARARRVEELHEMGLGCVYGDLLQEGSIVRHDQNRLTRLILDEFVKRSRADAEGASDSLPHSAIGLRGN